MKKIMFNDRYVLTEAVLSGRKTHTRRVASKFISDAVYIGFNRLEIFAGKELRLYNEANSFIKYKLPPYQVDEVVAIAQSYKDAGYSQYALNRAPKTMEIRGHMGESAGWNNKMFVRAEACNNHIRITNVRVERLQDISDEDCIKEGVVEWVDYDYSAGEPPMAITEYHIIGKETVRGIPHWSFNTPREAYAYLIDKVSGKGTWSCNPFVFVYDFELVK